MGSGTIAGNAPARFDNHRVPIVMSPPLFRIKICGVTTPADAAFVGTAGADAVGFNFVPGSPRVIDPDVARAARACLPAGVLAVGVFAGMPPDQMLTIARRVGLDAIQLHGHLEGESPATDPPARCRDIAQAGLKLIRAIRLGHDGLAAARRWISAANAHGMGPAMIIVDAGVPRDATAGTLGGTGHRVDWEALAREPALALPTALAGGLTPKNVAAAIQKTGAVGVDTASGVESALGRKDPERVRAFIAAAQAALAGQTDTLC